LEKKRVVIVGGGISGLSAAFYVQQLSKRQGIPVHITVLEKSELWGGKINTLRKEGFVIEKGPDSFLARKMSVIDLARDLGIEDQLVPMNPNAKKNYILNKGKLQLMPPGLMLGIPTEVRPFMSTPLLSLRGKLRAGLDLVLPRRKDSSDESLGGFISRRLGSEVLETITEPLLAGIYAGDTHSLSLKATFPQFGEMEHKYRSLILGMVLGKRKQKKAAASGAAPGAGTGTGAPKTGSGSAHGASADAGAGALPEAVRKSMFLTFRHGLSTMVEALVEALKQNGVELLTGCSVKQIERLDGHYVLQTADGERLEADGLIVAAPSFETGRLISDIPEVQSVCSIPYVSVANVVLAFDEAAVMKGAEAAFDGTGFLVPRREGRLITACTFTSVKWLTAAPKGKVLLRMYVGRQGMEGAVDKSDSELLEGVRRDLRNMTGIDAEPEFYEISRLRRSMPQYTPGHIERLEAARKALQEQRPGLLICGAGYDGVGVPDCIRQGKTAAKELVDFLV
jgi:protoporphyrinogen/coproporphyrinogen III oxidase